MAGVPGLEPRMAEPESAVLPITPYPTDHRNGWSEHSRALESLAGAVVQTTKDRHDDSPARLAGDVASLNQPAQAALPAEKFQRLEQRRADGRSGRRHPD